MEGFKPLEFPKENFETIFGPEFNVTVYTDHQHKGHISIIINKEDKDRVKQLLIPKKS
jgi:hypothetical protein